MGHHRCAAALGARAIARALGGEVTGGSILVPGPGHSRRDRSLRIFLDPAAPNGFRVHSFADDDPLLCRDHVREGLGLERDEFLNSVRWQAEHLRFDRSEGQEFRLVVTCEAAGMVPQLANAVAAYGIEVFSSGGFDSTTEKHALAAALADQERPTELLHIGDHDPSGVHMAIVIDEDVSAFARDLGGEIHVTRLAVTPAQIAALGLPTAPQKEGNKLAFTGRTCQAEAIAPDDLVRILREAVEERLDRDAFERVLRRERTARRKMSARLR